MAGQPLHKRISDIRTPVALTMVVVVAAHHVLVQDLGPTWHLPSEILVYGILSPLAAWILLGWLARSVEAAEKSAAAEAEAVARLTRRNLQIEALYSASRLLTAVRSFGDIAQTLVELAVQMSEAKRGALVFFDIEGESRPVAASCGDGAAALRAEILDHANAEPCLTCPDVVRCPLPENVRCLPIVAGRHVLGLLRLGEPVWNPATRQSLDALLGEVAAVWMARQAETRALSAMSRAGQGLRSARDIDQVLARFAELVCDAFGAAGLALYRFEDDGWQLRASSRQAPPPPRDEEPAAAKPAHRDHYVADPSDEANLVALNFDGLRPLSQRDVGLLQALASQAGLLMNITRHISEMLWRERRRMGQELHDGLAQDLAFLHLQTRRLADRLRQGQTDQLEADLAGLSGTALDAYDELRMSIDDLRLSPHTSERPAAFLRRITDSFARREVVRVTLDAPDELALSEDRLVEVTRIIQEALGNAVRHGKATEIAVRFAVDGVGLALSIGDNGAGFDPAAAARQPGHYGLAIMHERAESAGGVLRIESRPGAGAIVHVRFPTAPAGAAAVPEEAAAR